MGCLNYETRGSQRGRRVCWLRHHCRSGALFGGGTSDHQEHQDDKINYFTLAIHIILTISPRESTIDTISFVCKFNKLFASLPDLPSKSLS